MTERKQKLNFESGLIPKSAGFINKMDSTEEKKVRKLSPTFKFISNGLNVMIGEGE